MILDCHYSERYALNWLRKPKKKQLLLYVCYYCSHSESHTYILSYVVRSVPPSCLTSPFSPSDGSLEIFWYLSYAPLYWEFPGRAAVGTSRRAGLGPSRIGSEEQMLYVSLPG